MTGAVLGLAASLITFRGLWAAAGILPPPPPPVNEGEGHGQEKEASGVVGGAKPYDAESDVGVPGSTSYVEVKVTPA